MGQNDMASASNEEVAQIQDLIHELSSKEGKVRQRARRALVAIGKPTVAPLTAAMSDRNDHVRWEATKALSEIGDPSSAGALLARLEDPEFVIRWLAADGLISLGYSSLEPLLKALLQRPDSYLLREGAHHVLRVLMGEKGIGTIPDPVLKALNSVTPEMELPVAAGEALGRLGVEGYGKPEASGGGH